MDVLNVLIIIACVSVVLMFLVFIHEGGHYLASRAFGVRVSEFMIGFPGPGLKFKHGETKFGVTIIPLGGYARVCGMEAGEESHHLESVLASMHKRGTADVEDVANDCGISFDEAEAALQELVDWGSLTPPRRGDEYNTYRVAESVVPTRRQKKKLRARFEAEHSSVPCVLPSPSETLSTVEQHEPWWPARYSEGAPRPLPEGGARELYERERSVQYRSLPFWKRVVILLAGIAVNLLFALVCFVVVYSIIGFDYTMPDSNEVVHITVDPLRSITAGFVYIGVVVQAVASLFNPQTAAETVSNSTSIVGIAVMSKDAFAEGLTSALMFTSMISVSLGIMNLIPIPPLDGGRFLVEIIQLIIRRPLSARAMNTVTVAGMALFLTFFVFMLNQDIQRFVLGG